MRKNWWTSPGLFVLGHIFKDSEGIYAYQYNTAIMWPKHKYIGGVIQLSLIVLWKTMSDYWIKVNRKPTVFGGRLIVFGNNQNNSALINRLLLSFSETLCPHCRSPCTKVYEWRPSRNVNIIVLEFACVHLLNGNWPECSPGSGESALWVQKLYRIHQSNDWSNNTLWSSLVIIGKVETYKKQLLLLVEGVWQ